MWAMGEVGEAHSAKSRRREGLRKSVHGEVVGVEEGTRRRCSVKHRLTERCSKQTCGCSEKTWAKAIEEWWSVVREFKACARNDNGGRFVLLARLERGGAVEEAPTDEEKLFDF